MAEALDAQAQTRTRCKRCARWAAMWSSFRSERDPSRSLGVPGGLVRHLPALFSGRGWSGVEQLDGEARQWRPLCGHPYHGAEWLSEPW